jgi:hypothetical protein
MERENICALVLPSYASAFSVAGERCAEIRLVTDEADICPVVDTSRRSLFVRRHVGSAPKGICIGVQNRTACIERHG